MIRSLNMLMILITSGLKILHIFNSQSCVRVWEKETEIDTFIIPSHVFFIQIQYTSYCIFRKITLPVLLLLVALKGEILGVKPKWFMQHLILLHNYYAAFKQPYTANENAACPIIISWFERGLICAKIQNPMAWPARIIYRWYTNKFLVILVKYQTIMHFINVCL